MNHCTSCETELPLGHSDELCRECGEGSLCQDCIEAHAQMHG